MIYRLLLFLLINFGALAIGSIFTSKGVPSEWYAGLNKAPWTPPGWTFGLAWSTIMICFSFYMAYLWPKAENRNLLILLFALQWILNVSWNPTFFYFHFVLAGLLVILLLTLLTSFFLLYYTSTLKWKSLFILPYVLWLLVATSLNAYILLKN
ncbi:TspO/MBR family protein [Marinifilum caeruleilacunae]|uniref:Tryptophan-rich sensory protein n=1 Tax=Marinifilum caeruleilacunae TaxID=2499076 RepID=A0ABX1WR12_9BACT|nr:TspO/MBR family protein [Marinifilum caeruleilacunae]NOU58527.1 tryptophan-rich sensory protein [Marinifilum caeruleilacunae]